MTKLQYHLTREQFVEYYKDQAPRAEVLESTEDLKAFLEDKKVPALIMKYIMQDMRVPDAEIPPEKDSRITWILNNVQVDGITAPAQHEPQVTECAPGDSEQVHEPVQLQLTLPDVRNFFSTLSVDCLKPASEPATTPVTIYQDLPVDRKDRFLLQYQPGFYEGFVAVLSNDLQTVAAIGHLERDKEDYMIILAPENIDYEALQHYKKYRLVLFPEQAAGLFNAEQVSSLDASTFNESLTAVPCTINYKQTPDTHHVLCIDFGTSNTCAGSYGLENDKENNIELVSFVNKAANGASSQSFLYPTVVCVEDCSDQDDIKYLFGYDAKQYLARREFDTDASVFFEIKRWIGAMDEPIEIQDEIGRTLIVKRSDIVRAYLLEIIAAAEQHFKVRFHRLHLSAPVKLKSKFYEEIKDLLPEYEVLPPEQTVDEGIAIIYSRVAELLRNNDIPENETSSIMILDCGGGTTDLASCELTAETLDAGQRLDITTRFMNGNSNFGGNNITFRIFQLLKIKLAAQYGPDVMGDCDLLTALIPEDEISILNTVENERHGGSRQFDSDAVSAVYANFVEAYERAENVIPTVFSNNARFPFQPDERRIRRNFYFLWQLAERIKLKFYEEDLVSVDFRASGDQTLEFERPDNYYLYVSRDEKRLERQDNAAANVEITINEVRRALCGDIYGLLNGLLSQPGIEPDAYQLYRLAGQSCKINLFMELLKEFIPGKRLRSVSAHQNDRTNAKGSAPLKLDCVEGCIEYIRDKEYGKIRPELAMGAPELIYDIYLRKANTEQKLVKRGNEEDLVYAAVPATASQVELLVKDSAGRVERKINVDLTDTEKRVEGELDALHRVMSTQSSVDPDHLRELLDEVQQADPSELAASNKVHFVFALPARDGYGMHVYRLTKTQTGDSRKYSWWTKTPYENYENEASKSFFDGTR